jgi:hypothetical protein
MSRPRGSSGMHRRRPMWRWFDVSGGTVMRGLLRDSMLHGERKASVRDAGHGSISRV